MQPRSAAALGLTVGAPAVALLTAGLVTGSAWLYIFGMAGAPAPIGLLAWATVAGWDARDPR